MFSRSLLLIILLNVSMIYAEKPGLITGIFAWLNPTSDIVGEKDMVHYKRLFDNATELEAQKIKGPKMWPEDFEEEFKLGTNGDKGTTSVSAPYKELLKKYRDQMRTSWLKAAVEKRYLLDSRAIEFAKKYIKTNADNENIAWQSIQDDNFFRAARPMKIILGLLVGAGIVAGASYGVYKKVKARKQVQSA